jgi:Uma2 family endonuclease
VRLTQASWERQVTVGFRFTSADLARMPDIEGVRYEIIDGELYVSRQADEAHQHVCAVLSAVLYNWGTETGAGLVIPAPGLVFSEDNDVIPDLVWISPSAAR